MSIMTALDIPVVRSAGFQAGFSGHSWHGMAKDGTPWQAIEEEITGNLHFATPGQAKRPMDRAEFAELFEGKKV
jgi:hypothetical protein